jgi:isopenicillin-N epimerase
MDSVALGPNGTPSSEHAAKNTSPHRPLPLSAPSGLPAASDWSLNPTFRHLNHGSFGAVPRETQHAQRLLQAEMDANPSDWFVNVAERVRPARQDVAKFLRVSPPAMALVPNASAGVSVVYSNIPTWSGMRIVTTDHTYGAVLMGAERLARRHNGVVTVVHIPLDSTEDDVFERIAAEMTPDVGLVVIDHVTSPTARLMPAGRIATHGRHLGIPVLVDAAHSPGLFAEPLAGIDADFWVGNLHKFGCAPRGTAALVASGPHSQSLYPLIDSWGSPEEFPARFDQQGTVDVTSYLAARTSFDLVETHYGWDSARAYMTELADYAQTIVSGALSEVSGEDAAVDVGVPVNALRLIQLPMGLANNPDTARELWRQFAVELRIQTAITSWGGRGYLRLSTHVYNTAEDYEDLVERGIPFIMKKAQIASHDT